MEVGHQPLLLFNPESYPVGPRFPPPPRSFIVRGYVAMFSLIDLQLSARFVESM